MKTSTKINILIDTHPNIAFTECEGCPQCDKIRELGEKLDITKPEKSKFEHILDKGEDMTTEDLKILLDNDIPHSTIMAALGFKTHQLFKEMAKPFLKQRPRKIIQLEDFVKLRHKGMSNGEIADKYNINLRTLANHIQKWKETGAISQDELNSLPRRSPGRKLSAPLLTKEQYMHAKEQGWTKAKMVREYKVSYVNVKRSIELYEVAE